MWALMLHQPLPSDANALDLTEELGRARRIFLALNDPDDLRILEAYIAELEAQQRFTAETSGRLS
jgi:hypothetical protein